MGNIFGAPYEQVEYQSGASRLLNSIVMAICVAPLLILGMCVMLGWNEQRAVCSQKAISSGRDAVQRVGCDNAMAGNGALVLFACDIDTKSLPVLQFSNPGDFSLFQYQGVGIEVDSYMYQCIESESKRTEKTQGGGTKTITTYSYSMDWKSDVVDSRSFGTQSSQASDAFYRGCNGRRNPTWDPATPRPQKKYASQMKVGAFTTTMTDKVPIDAPIPFAPPSGWQTSGVGSFYKYQAGSYPQIGDMKLSLKTNSPSRLTATVLGKNMGGLLSEWTAPSSWLCSGFTLSDLRMGTVSTDDFFNQLSSESTAVTWALRFVGFIVMWFAFCLCFGPLEVAADCIPCVGPWIGDSIAAISCCVSCLPATACTLGVAGAVWVVMRPLIGIPFMLAFVIIIGGFGFYVGKQRAAKRGVRAVQVTPNMSMAQPIITPQVTRQMQVQAPIPSFPGQSVQFRTPEGTMMTTQVPQGVAPGGFFTISY